MDNQISPNQYPREDGQPQYPASPMPPKPPQPPIQPIPKSVVPEEPPEVYPYETVQKTIKQKIKSFFVELAKFMFIFGITFIISFVAVNWPAIKRQWAYWQKLRSGDTVKKFLVVPKDVPQEVSKKPGREIYPLAENQLFIPKIDVLANIVWNIPEKDIVANLHKGVVHYDQSAFPGEKGTVFITGHSSYYWWSKGPYDAIFALLNRLEKGDEIAINYKNTIYIYQVSESFVVSPYQVEVMKSSSEKKSLTLMTCVPVGTNFRRLIINAVQFTPQE